MTALLKSVAISLAANAASLAVAAWIFDRFNVEFGWYVVAVVLVTLLIVALREVVTATVNRFARGYTIVGGLVLTWLALFLTDAARAAQRLRDRRLGHLDRCHGHRLGGRHRLWRGRQEGSRTPRLACSASDAGNARYSVGASLISAMTSPEVTVAPTSTDRPVTTPSLCALIGCSIFMASTTTIWSPAATV